MNFIREIFAIPFGYVIGFFYDMSGNYLLSLFLMTLVVKLILLPFSVKQQNSMVKSQRMQPKIRRIREKYANNQAKMNEEMNALYAREGYGSMTGGCSSMLVQLPVMMGVYLVNYRILDFVLKIPKDVIAVITEAVQKLPDFENNARNTYQIQLIAIERFNELDLTGVESTYIDKINGFIDKFTLFGVNLYETPNVKMGATLLWLIPVLTGVSSLMIAVYSYIKQKKTNPEMAKNPSMGCMTLMSPAMSIYFSFLFPASVGVYIIMSSFLSFFQTIILGVTHSPKKVLARTMVKETINRRAREKVLKTAADKKDDE